MARRDVEDVGDFGGTEATQLLAASRGVLELDRLALYRPAKFGVALKPIDDVLHPTPPMSGPMSAVTALFSHSKS